MPWSHSVSFSKQDVLIGLAALLSGICVVMISAALGAPRGLYSSLVFVAAGIIAVRLAEHWRKQRPVLVECPSRTNRSTRRRVWEREINR
jgi:hypothetical protein